MHKIFDTDVDWQKLITQANRDYKFQPRLTEKLENYEGDFSEVTLLEIFLWKTNRYPDLNIDIINDINGLRKAFSIDKSKVILKKLLALKGFDLPMASTVLRFASPNNFQIIDQRVYRFIMKDVEIFKKSFNDERKIEIYFEYLERLKVVCHEHKIPFHKADRIIYQLDKNLNWEHPIKY